MQRCAHPGCGCDTDAEYCSGYCEAHGTHEGETGEQHDCGCGHDACRTAALTG